jgi:thiamine-monophosphate kinase
VTISVALIGTIEKNRAVLRSGAISGDAIFVTGCLGGSILGRHLDFEPRLIEADWLVRHFDIHSMIDLSDGLAGDLRHILEAGKVGAELLAPAIPISRDAKRASVSGKKSPLDAALTDGEDFELLFTLKSADAVPLLDAWRHQFPTTPLACIGKITAKPGLVLRDRDRSRQITEKGYEHFA